MCTLKHSNNVWGGWFGKIGHGSLKSAALFGDHVNLSEDFSRLDAAGTLTSLNCALTFEKKSFDFTITLNKTVVIMQHGTPEEDLDLLLALKPILYKEISDMKILQPNISYLNYKVRTPSVCRKGYLIIYCILEPQSFQYDYS
ncbi:hypothetical protein [Brevibacillus laterosporus]|uniref:hypothetical protein n=1 Tax=Brevibacillus laterosporus TaxID=1465 RepID=UPI000CE570F0|nr:hypothetical protein [Brevibacillus laterosporus]MED1721016.1 hypothetical protein [Brevibacillus laterosporus]PPA83933.1 hypothetical protein C4A76_18400 [Brevibacillus laterosporus]